MLQNKIPEISSKITHRPRLLDSLQRQFSTRRITLLNAPAGFGKSTALSQFLQYQSIPHVWYNLSSEDRDPGIMLDSFAFQILQTFPKAPGDVRSILKKTDKETSRSAKCARIFKFLSSICKRGVYLMLDDFHKAEAPENFRETLNLMVQRSPENAWIVISSRNDKPFDPCHVLYNQANKLTGKKFCFTPQEVRQLFYENYDCSITHEQAGQIKHFCGGWPLGVNLIAAHLSSSSEIEGLKDKDLYAMFQDKKFSEYLAGEFLNSFSGKTREFLISSSVFEIFNIEMCREIIAEEEADKIIDELTEKGLIHVRKSSSGQTWYEYPELFRSFFKELLEEQFPRAVKTVKTKEIIGTYFANNDYPLEAIDQFLKARCYEKALSLLEKNMDHFISKSLAKELLTVIDKFPNSYMNTKAVVSFAKGWSLFFLGDYRQALHFLDTALKTAKKENHEYLIGRAIQITASIYFSLDNFSKLISFIRDQKKNVSADHPVYPEILRVFAQALGQLGCMKEAEAAWKELEEHPVIKQDPQFGHVICAIKAYNYLFLLGRLPEAEQGMRSALEAFRAEDRMGISARVMAYYGSVKYIQGYLEESRDIIAQAISDCEKTNQIFAQKPFLLLQAMNELDLGRPGKAAKALEKFMENGRNTGTQYNGEEEYVWKGYLVHAVKAALAEYKGNFYQFRVYAQRAIQMVGRKDSFLDIYFLYTFLAVRYIRQKDPEYAQELLEELEDFLFPVKTPYFKAHTWLLLALALYKKGDEDAAGVYLQKALYTARENQYEFLFLYKERMTTLQLEPILLKAEENFDFISSILINLNPSSCEKLVIRLKEEEKAEKKISVIQALANNHCRDSERQIRCSMSDKNRKVRQTARAAAEKMRSLPPLPLTVFTLGGFRLKVGHRDVPPEAWKRKKAISLFVYFLIHSNQKIGLEKIMEEFFPEASPPQAKSHLQSLVSHLRTILEPGLPPKKESKYIRSESEAYFFVGSENSYVDVFEFERLSYEAARAKTNGDYSGAFYRYRAAAAIYQGNFLPEAVYEEWVEQRRAHYKWEYIKILYGLAYGHFDRMQYHDCESSLKTLLYHDPLDEKAYLLLMKCYTAWGHRTKALKTYLQCRDVMKQELGTSPAKELTDLYYTLANTGL